MAGAQVWQGQGACTFDWVSGCCWGLLAVDRVWSFAICRLGTVMVWGQATGGHLKQRNGIF